MVVEIPFIEGAITPYQLIYNFFIPFIFIFVLSYGVLKKIGLFGSKINTILALTIPAMILLNPSMGFFREQMSIMGAMSVYGMFIALFGFGVLMWGLNKGRDITYTTANVEAKMKKLYDKKHKAVNKYKHAGSQKDRIKWGHEIDEIDRELMMLKYERRYR